MLSVPNPELGFTVDHNLGEYNEKPEVLASRKASSAKVSISGLRIVK